MLLSIYFISFILVLLTKNRIIEVVFWLLNILLTFIIPLVAIIPTIIVLLVTRKRK